MRHVVALVLVILLGFGSGLWAVWEVSSRMYTFHLWASYAGAQINPPCPELPGNCRIGRR